MSEKKLIVTIKISGANVVRVFYSGSPKEG